MSYRVGPVQGRSRRGRVKQYPSTPVVAHITITSVTPPNFEPTETYNLTGYVESDSVPLPNDPDQLGRQRLSGRTVTFTSSNPSAATVGSSTNTAADGTFSITVTAEAVGSATILPMCEGVVDDTLDVTVTSPQSAVDSVTLSATTASGVVGNSVTFQARARDASNNILTGKTITWTELTGTSLITTSADSGDENHEVTVDLDSAGSATLKATCEGVDSATITVTISASSGDYPNQPAGMTTLLDHGFSTTANWFNVGGAEAIAIVSDAGAPKSPNDVLEYSYIDASQGSFAGRKWSFSEQSELYICIWFKIQDPWDYHSSSVNKMFFVDTNASPSLDNEIVFGLIGSTEGNAEMRGIAQTPMGGSYRPCNVNSGAWSLGDWHKLEIHLVKSTGGSNNGRMRWWIDEVEVGDHTDMRYANSGDGKFDGFLLQPYYGGTPEDKAQVDKIFYDHLFISGKL